MEHASNSPACPHSSTVWVSRLRLYFVHSYYARPEDSDVIAAEADYPEPFAAVVWRDNLTACQFHPEKSQRVGLAMYTNFVAA